MSFDPDAYLAGTVQTKDGFDPDAWLRGEPQPGKRSAWTNTAHTFATGASEAAGSALEGGLRMVSSLPELVGKAAEWYTQLDQNRTPAEREATVARIQANTQQIRPELRAGGGLSAAIAEGMELAGKGAEQVHETRTAIQRTLPVDKAFAESTFGGVTAGLGQVAAQIPLYLSGVGLPATVSQMYDQGYQDAKAHGSDEGTAALAGLGNMPGAALEFVADKFQLGPILELVKKQKVVKSVAGKAAEGLAERLAAGVGNVVKAGATESATEAAQQGLGNVVAGGLYDPDREVTDGMAQAALVGGLTGSAVRGLTEGAAALLDRTGDDSGRTVPEAEATLRAQQAQLVEGRRPAMMFPAGTSESLELPKGFARVETPRGVFHFDPNQVSAEKIWELSEAKRENEILAMGESSEPKERVLARARAGDPVTSVTERAADGTEVKAVAANESTAASIARELERSKSPGSIVATEAPAQTILERLRADLEETERAQKEAQERERAARAQRQDELRAKQERFESTLSAAQALAADPQADFPKLSAALTSLRHYVDDNSLGLRQEQRNAALAQVAKLQPRVDAAKAAHEQQQAQAAAKAQQEAKAAEAATRERREQEKQAFAAQVRAGIGPSGEVDYKRLRERDLEARANAGDTRAQRELIERAELEGDPRETFLEALQKVKLPASDAGLAAELEILREDMTPGQLRTLISTTKDSLDRTAEALRGRGFSQVVTPDDVITFTQRALRGEDIRADEASEDQVGGVHFATENRLKIKPLEDLSEEERAHETRFAEQLNSATDEESDAQYAALPESQGGRVFNTDIARDLYPGFKGALRARLSRATHRPASRYIRDLFSRTLKKTTSTEFPIVRILAGGGGSGKSSVLKRLPQKKALTYDTTLSKLEDAISLIDEALAAGRRVAVEYVHRPIEGAIAGAIHRARNPSDGRTVPLATLAKAHFGAQQTLAAVAERYRGNRRVRVKVWDNSGPEGSVQRVRSPIDFIRSKGVHYDNENEVHKRVENEWERHSSGLSDTQRQGFRPDDGRGIRGVGRTGHAGRPEGAQSGHIGGSGPAAAYATERAAPPRLLTAVEVERQWTALKKALGPIAREFELKIGIIADILEGEGYAREAQLLREGRLGAVSAATAPRVQQDAVELAAQKQFIVVAASAAQQGKAPGLLLHELAHPFFDGLPEDTRDVLRQMHNEETTRRTGPLYRDGKPVSDIAITAEDLPAARVRADPDLPVKEWFAERVRRLNESWLNGEMAIGGQPVILRLARKLWEQLRRIFAQIRGLDMESDLFADTFRTWLASGTRANIAPEVAAFAQRKRVELATHPADITGAPIDAQRVDYAAERPKLDRKTALLEFWRAGKKMRDDGMRAGNEEAEMQGAREMQQAKAILEEEFPGWEADAYGPKEATRSQADEDDGRNLPPEAEAEPTDQGTPNEDPPPPMRPGAIEGVYGHTQHMPGPAERAKEYIRRVIVGIRGSVPELPTFPALARKTDRFIRAFGDQFYNRLREFQRTLASGNDYIQHQAQEQVAAITTPLLNLGGRFAAADYRKLQERQRQLRTLRAEGKPMPHGALAELEALNRKLESNPYILFNRFIVMLDLDWRQRNLKDSEGNPIRLPNDINTAEVAAELRALTARIEASPHKSAIEAAVRAHMGLVQRVADDLKGRELLASDHLNNPYYFPHLTLQVTRGDKTVERELKPERVRVGTEADFRGYLIDPVGSSKPIETDYVRALYYHLVQVGAHNLKADAVRDYVRPYDIRAEVEAEAKRLSARWGRLVSWEQAFHHTFEPQGYVMYGTDSRDAFPSVMVDRDKLARRLGVLLTQEDLHKQLAELGLKGVTLQPEDLQETLIQGQREVWIVPARVAEALRGIAARQVKTDQPIEAALKALNSWWKRWKLFMPQNHIRYEYGNIVADLEKLWSATPRTFKYLGRAAKEMREFFGGGAPSEDLRAALKEGAINAITAQEMGQLQRLRAFEKFETKGERVWREMRKRASAVAYQPITQILGLGDLSSVELSALREGIVRYANFLANLEAIRNGARPDYAGAYWRDVEAIGDSRKGAGDRAVRQAAQISKATFGDYGDLSVTGQYLRDNFIPFYSWIEVNFRYHANLLRNLRDMVREGELSQAEARTRMAKIGAAAASTMARKAGGVALRLALPYAAIAIWNNTGERADMEDELSEEDRRRTHIILGRDDKGHVQVVYGNTALADVMKWFGGAKFAQNMGQWQAGRMDFLTALTAWLAETPGDLANNTLGSIGPVPKIAVTAITGQSTFPDVLNPRTIPTYDLRRHILGQMTDDFTADMVERLIGKDYMAQKDIGDWAKQIILQVRKRDPEQWAYYRVREKAEEFLEQKTGVSRGNFSGESVDQQALRNFRKAMYSGDVAQAQRFYMRLLDYGYTAERFAASVRSQDPLSGLTKTSGLRQAFVDSLDSVDQEMLRRAYRYSSRLTAARGFERALFPSEKGGEWLLERYRENPQFGRLHGIIEQQSGRSEEAAGQEAERDIRRSLMRRR